MYNLLPGADPGICVRGPVPILPVFSYSASFPLSLSPLPSPLDVGPLKPARGLESAVRESLETF